MTVSMYAALYDLAAVIFLIFSVRHGARVGFARSFVRIAGYVLVLAAALVLARLGSVFLFNTVLAPRFLEALESSVLSSQSIEQLLADLQTALEELPAISYLFFELADASTALESVVGQSAERVASAVLHEVFRPVLLPLLRGLFFLIVFLVGCALVRAVARTAGVVKEIPVVGGLDRFCGGVLGVVEAFLVLCLVCIVLDIVLALWPDRWEWLSQDIFSRTYLFRWSYLLMAEEKALGTAVLL